MIQGRKYMRLTKKEKRTLIQLHDSGEWKGVELAQLFGITPSRVSQLINDYYQEREGLETDERQQ